MPAALAIELVHTFSLVHDDLPAMDDDDERRGQPSTWKKFGEGVGVLAGDALLAEAFRLAARYESSAVARELAEATLGMIGGQYLDTMVEGYDLAAVHRLKTGRLFYASVTLALWAAELPAGGAGAVARFRGGARAAVPDRRRHPRRGRLRPGARPRRRAPLRRRGRRAGARAARRGRRGHLRPARHRRRPRRSHGLKKRLDVLLVERGLAESRAQAQALVMAGLVPGYDKPGQQVAEDTELVVEQRPEYVSRGGEKLAHGLDLLGVDPAGLDCVDVGASTGGFTDVLLRRGAARVIALDVGYGQLHLRLRGDTRVTVLERTNARTVAELPFAPQLAVCDVSFISVRLALPPVLRLCSPGWQAVVLVKPQFEAGRADVGKGGVVRDDEVRRRVVREVAEAALSWGASTRGVVDSGLPGPKGNREIFVHLVHSEQPTLPDDLDQRIEQALAG